LISQWTKSDWSGVDVSGGAGRWLGTLAPRFRQFTHLDLSRDALCVARADHPEFANVEFGTIDLLRPGTTDMGLSRRTWDAVFCLDTLLYRGAFVETALQNIQTFMSPRGIAIVDLPMQFRASVSRRVKGRHYGGPERTFSTCAARVLANNAGYVCLASAYQYRELPASTHRLLAERGLTSWIPWPSTWVYLVLRVAPGPSTRPGAWTRGMA
jgi:SAM-dependent methyltransferase